MTIRLTVRAESHFIRAATAYNDQVKHGYDANHIDPTTRHIELTARGLPPTTRTLEWRVIRRSDKHQFGRSQITLINILDGQRSSVFNLPLEGVYDCQVVATTHDGRKQKSDLRSVDLRDFLVMVIGDSYASREGNPDERGQLNVK